MFTYTHEMQQAIYDEIQKIAKYRVFDPKRNIYKQPMPTMDRKSLCAWHFEEWLYRNKSFEPFLDWQFVNEIGKAAQLAQDFYNRWLGELKRRAGEDGYKWYLSLPVK